MKLWRGGGHVPAGSWWQPGRGLWLLAGLLFVASLTVSVVGSTRSFAAPATFTVTTTNDSGAGSLRQAITDANSNGNPSDQDVIEFTIPGGGDQTIQPQTPLTITESVLVDGYTQGDAEENTKVWPEPLNGTIRIGIDALNGGIIIQSNDVTIRGLAITAYSGHQITATNSDRLTLTGNYIGVIQNGFDHYWGNGAGGGYGGGILITSSDDVQVGGSTPNDRNVIGRCGDSCIELQGTIANSSSNAFIAGNNIGIAFDSVAPLTANGLTDPPPGDGVGIEIAQYTSGVRIGDSLNNIGNYIAYNTNGALYAKDTTNLTFASNWVINNWAGVGAPVYGGGIVLEGVTGATIGGNAQAQGNIVAGNDNGSLVIRNSSATNTPSTNIAVLYNNFGVMNDNSTAFSNFIGRAAVSIDDTSHDIYIRYNTIHNTTRTQWITTGAHGISTTNAVQNVAILQNSIYNNQGIGIDLNGNNIHEINDAGDGDTGSNGLLNSPGYTNITETAGNTDVEFSLDAPAGNYRIEFFSNTTPDSSGIGEGQTYIGFMNITHTGSGLEAFSTTLAGTGHTNLALTATEINPSTPSGFGASSEFGGVGATPAPSRDIRATKRIMNPQDKSVGNVLQYEIKITNDGPDDLDLSTLNSTVPGSNYLFVDILPPQLQYSGISGPNIACQDYGLGSASFFGPLLANHSDHSIVVCGHDNTNDILAAGQSVSYTLSATVIDLTNPTFTNHVIVQPDVGDPDVTTFGALFNGNSDLIDALNGMGNVNNYANAYSEIADISLEGGLDNPQDAGTAGATLNYTIRYVNAGPSAIDPTIFNSGGMNPLVTSIFIGFIPPNLTYVSQSNPDVNCTWFGPGSASLTPFFANHMDYSIFYCAYTGSDTSLAAGESIQSTFHFITNASSNSFTSYFIGNALQNDSDYSKFPQLFAYSGGPAIDVIDRMNVSPFNNILRASYQKNNPSIQTTSTTSLLSQTGSRYILMILIGSLLLGISAYAMYVRNKKT